MAIGDEQSQPGIRGRDCCIRWSWYSWTAIPIARVTQVQAADACWFPARCVSRWRKLLLACYGTGSAGCVVGDPPCMCVRNSLADTKFATGYGAEWDRKRPVRMKDFWRILRAGCDVRACARSSVR